MAAEHRWNLTGAWQVHEHGGTVDLVRECEDCGTEWRTCSGVTMPDSTAGDCEVPSDGR